MSCGDPDFACFLPGACCVKSVPSRTAVCEQDPVPHPQDHQESLQHIVFGSRIYSARCHTAQTDGYGNRLHNFPLNQHI